MLRFIDLTLTNFGPYKGTQKIVFPERNGVIIFWGDNARGKTTLLNAFRFALFGTIQRRNNALNSLKSMENIEAYEAGEYGFSVVLHMQSDDDDFLLTREFKPRNGVQVPRSEEDYAKKLYLKKNGSLLAPEDTEHELSLLLPEHVSRFFLFDGELLQEYEELLIDDTTTGERIKSAIERILGVPVLTNGRQDIDYSRSDLVKRKSRAVKDDGHAKQYANTLEGIDSGIEEHKKRINELDGELKEQWGKKAQLEEQMNKTEQIREWQTSVENLQKNLAINEKTYEGQIIEMRAAMKDAWRGMLRSRIDECLVDFKERCNVLEVKKAQKTILDSTVNDLKIAIENRRCPVCHQSVEGDVLLNLSQQLEQNISNVSLSAEEQTELAEISGKIRTLTNMLRDSARSKVRSIENQLDNLGILLDEDNKKIKVLQKHIAEYGGDTNSARGIPVQYQKVLLKIDNLTEALREERVKLDEKIASHESIMDQIRKLESGNDLRIATQKLDYCQQLYNLFDEGIGRYRDALRKHVEHDATELFVQVTGDPDYVSLKINSNYGLSIIHKSGKTVPGRSSGYEHIVALSLIGALHKNAPLRGPIIVDSPFGRLDKTHKKNIAHTLPNMADQVILFAYNGEIERSVAIEQLSDNLLREYSLQRISSMHTEVVKGV